MSGQIVIGAQTTLTPEQATAIAQGALAIRLSGDVRARCARSHARLRELIAQARHVYGVTTGFGPLANRLVAPEDAVQLQQNLVHHLASGVGPKMGFAEARAVVLARLASILQGYSGASAAVIDRLVALLNTPLAPCLPAKGTVGASGDLTPLSHLVLCLQGRGSFIDATGIEVEAIVALERMGLSPLDLGNRDGLALVNGTSAMTGLAVLSAVQANAALEWAVCLTAGLAEVQGAYLEAWESLFARARPHPGQAWAAEALRHAVRGGGTLHRDPIALKRVGPPGHMAGREPGQDAYTIRCAPQVIGAVRDLADWHHGVVTTELNAATDNPLLPQAGDVLALHGGNFMGQHVGLASDALLNGLIVLAGFAERQMARLTDEKLNRGLPAFLHRGRGGINSGFMGAQVTATALVAEMRARGGSASIQSISTNGANQDVVSMGTIAARGVRSALADLARVQAILAMALAQAMDLREQEGAELSDGAHRLRDRVREYHAEIHEDRPLGAEIEALAEAMANGPPPLA